MRAYRGHGGDRYAFLVPPDINARKWVKAHADETEYTRKAGTKPLRVRVNGIDQYYKTYSEAYYYMNQQLKGR